MRNAAPSAAVLIWFTSSVVAQECPASAVATTTTPAPPPTAVALDRYRKQIKSIPERSVDIVLIGDSLVAWWQQKYWDDLQLTTYNLGTGGDHTQHLLWRLRDTHLSHLAPQWVVVLVGTNNLAAGDPPCAVERGVTEVIDQAKNVWPNAQPIVINIPPRGERWGFKQDERTRTNDFIDQWARKKKAITLDVDLAITCSFTVPCGNYLDDLLHFSAGGYRVLTKSVINKIRE